MDQMALFALEDGPREAGRRDAVPIRSGRIGPIRFGATEASFALTQAVLADLTARADVAGDLSPR